MKSQLNLFFELSKLRLTTSVVFSSLAGFLIAGTICSLKEIVTLLTGGFLIVACSNIINQIIEVKSDRLMARTESRPLPEQRITQKGAIIMSLFSGLIGLFLLYTLNAQSALFGLLAVFLYTLVYTPLKKRTPFSVFVGAVPGAIPFMLGWVAATNDFDIEAGILFAIQFTWQLPHFWSIAWVLDEDYKKAGFFLLPFLKRNKKSSLTIVLFSLLLIPISVLPFFVATGDLQLNKISGGLIVLLGSVFLLGSMMLHVKQDIVTAKKLMFLGLFYLPCLQIIYILNTFLNGV